MTCHVRRGFVGNFSSRSASARRAARLERDRPRQSLN
jgi:hypothetical protein